MLLKLHLEYCFQFCTPWYSLLYNILLSNKKALWKEQEGGGQLWLWCLSSQATIKHTEALFTRTWVDICFLMGHSELIPLLWFFFGSSAQILFSQLNCLYPKPYIFSPSFDFLPIPPERGVSERQSGCLAAGQGQPITALFGTSLRESKRTVYGHNTENLGVSKVRIIYHFSLGFWLGLLDNYILVLAIVSDYINVYRSSFCIESQRQCSYVSKSLHICLSIFTVT